MKPKTIYILMIICAMSLIAAAKQADSKCDKQKCCKAYEQKGAKKLAEKQADKTRSDHSPLSICLFSI